MAYRRYIDTCGHMGITPKLHLNPQSDIPIVQFTITLTLVLLSVHRSAEVLMGHRVVARIAFPGPMFQTGSLSFSESVQSGQFVSNLVRCCNSQTSSDGLYCCPHHSNSE